MIYFIIFQDKWKSEINYEFIADFPSFFLSLGTVHERDK